MSIYAALGYALGVIIFAWFIRRNRRKMINKHIANAQAKRAQSEKDSGND